ncbi:Hypothetical predicted protein [Pelobates cultripes]|uniref:Uncharacterized protein n=1 Tax=Pelobates cultripes TaxID=61616 RepID=A0AAD1T3Q9_PELCU|nr:Hypothetical predicted protein [Pelobates cultripes]
MKKDSVRCFSAPRNKMAAGLGRRGRRLPAGTGSAFPGSKTTGETSVEIRAKGNWSNLTETGAHNGEDFGEALCSHIVVLEEYLTAQQNGAVSFKELEGEDNDYIA